MIAVPETATRQGCLHARAKPQNDCDAWKNIEGDFYTKRTADPEKQAYLHYARQRARKLHRDNRQSSILDPGDDGRSPHPQTRQERRLRRIH
jgi:hypothetical protein